MERKLLHEALKAKAHEGGYDFVVVDNYVDGEFDPDGGVPVCDRVPAGHAIDGDERWAWVAAELLILFASKEDEEAAEKFVSCIKKLSR